MKASPFFLSALLVSIMLHTTLATAGAELSAIEKNTPIPVKATQKTFLKNTGQWSTEILYDGNFPDGKVRFLKSGLSFGISIKEEEEESPEHSAIPFEPSIEQDSIQIFNLVFKNSNPDAIVKAKNEQASVYNYINHLGNFSHVPESNSILYANIYNNIDIEYYKTEDARFEYDVILKPGAKASDLVFSYDGINSINLNNNGELAINTGRVILTENMPLSYQDINGEITEVAVKYKLINNNTYGFEITGNNYNPAYDLIIDPFFRKWGTYLRMQHQGYSHDNVTDNQGNIYLTGWISGQYTTQSGTVTSANLDAYVAKITSDGSNLFYFTLIGGSNIDIAYGIDVDNTNAAYITGSTQSTNFPHTLTGYGNTYNGAIRDAFITKLNTTGTTIDYSRFIGGSNDETGRDVVVDDNTLIPYVSGYTNSINFTTTAGVVQTSNAGSNDAFIIGINPILTASNPIVSTLYGGTFSDGSNCIFRNATTGDIYIAGFAQPLFPATGAAFQTVWGGSTDGFVAKFNSNLSTVNYATYIGGSALEEVIDIDVNNSGDAFITGYTMDDINSSPHFPTTSGAFQTNSAGSRDAFAAKLNNSGGTLLYSTFLGGTLNDNGTDIKAGRNGTAYVTGYTQSSNFPTTPGNFQSIFNGGSYDIFLSQLNATGSAFAIGGSTFIGGNLNDYVEPKISINKTGCSDTLIINGTSHSANFPVTAGAYQTTNISTGGTEDQPVVIKFSVDTCKDVILDLTMLSIDDLIYPDTVCAGSCFTIKAAIVSGFPTPNNIQVSFPGATINYYNQDTLRITICPVNPGNLQLFIFQNLNLGNYPPTIKNFTVLPAPAPFSLGPDKLICPGSAVTLFTPPLTGITYSWTGPGVTGTSSAHVSASNSGTYILTATNAVGCSVSDTIKLFTLDDMYNTFITYTNCYAPVGVQLNAGQGAVSYSWSPVAGLSNPFIQNPIATPAVTTTYTVVATFANGCVDTGDVVVTVPPVPVYSIGGPLTVCEGSCIKFTVPRDLCVASAVWFYSSLNNTEAYLGSGNTICATIRQSGNYCVKIITCDGCEYLLCRQITVVTGKACKNLPVTDDRCCTISTERLVSDFKADNTNTLFAVYPNPANGSQLQLTFETTNATSVKINLLNALGQLQSVLFNENTAVNSSYNRSIDISKLSTGIYFVVMESNGVTKTIKFVKE